MCLAYAPMGLPPQPHHPQKACAGQKHATVFRKEYRRFCILPV